MNRKVVFWLAPNEILIPADQVPGTIAEALYPPSERDVIDGVPHDPDAVNRLKTEREQAQKLREKYPNLPDDYKFAKDELVKYLNGIGLEVEVRSRLKSKTSGAEKPEPSNYYSYQQTLAILEKRLNATDGEMAMWLVLGETNGGINAYLHVHEFAEPPQATLDNLHFHPRAPEATKPPYLNALVGMYFKRDEIEKFNPNKRYISYGALKKRWMAKGYIREESEFNANIFSGIQQSRLHDYVPGDGFSSLGVGSDNVPPEWAMFDKDEVDDFEAEDFKQQIGAGLIGWYDGTLDASYWFGRRKVAAEEAATLLCRQNPLDDSRAPLSISTDETNPLDFKRLLRDFEEVTELDVRPRTLMQWLAIARDKRLKYHSWIDEYIAAVDDTKSAQFQPSTVDDSTCQLSTATTVFSGASIPNDDAPTPNLFALPGVSTTDIIEAFNLVGNKWNDLRRGSKYWKAIHTPGGRGRGMHTWKPADFAICLLETGERKLSAALRTIIKNNWPDWLPEFESQLEEIGKNR